MTMMKSFEDVYGKLYMQDLYEGCLMWKVL
jgi:hypothetical protein